MADRKDSSDLPHDLPESMRSHRDVLDVISAVYGRCHPNSLIALGARRPNRQGQLGVRFLGVVRARDRFEWLPPLFRFEVERSQYVCSSTLTDGALVGGKYEDYLEAIQEGRPLYFRKTQRNIRELCGIWLDLDVGRPGMDLMPGQTLGAVVDATLKGKIPMPSLAALSGQGAYVIWLLRDGQETRPPENTPDNRAKWLLCTSELLDRLSDFCADYTVLDYSKWFKRPGTTDWKTGKEVIYLTFGRNALNNTPLYDLSELTNTLELQHAPLDVTTLPPAVGQADFRLRPQRTNRQRRVGALKGSEPHVKRATEIERLSRYRHGMREGCRYWTIHHYFRALHAVYFIQYRGTVKGQEKALAQAYKQARRLNKAFKPPLSSAEIGKACRHQKPMKNKTLAAHLLVTEREAVDLVLESLVPSAIAKLRAKDDTKRTTARKGFFADRRRVVDAAIQQGLSTSDIIARYGTEHRISKQLISQRRKHVKLPTVPELSF